MANKLEGVGERVERVERVSEGIGGLNRGTASERRRESVSIQRWTTGLSLTPVTLRPAVDTGTYVLRDRLIAAEI